MNVKTHTIAVVGLGNMGGAVAANLARRGHVVIGYDMQDAARRSAAEAGVVPSDTIADAVRDADVIITSLPNGAIVRSVWLGETGVVAHARRDALVIELSTISQQDMVAVADAARDAGLRVVDCAVSGSPAQGGTGDLSLIIGAADGDYVDAEPLLREIGATLEHVGVVGDGKVVKLVNNLMAMGNVLVAAEAFQVGVAAGIDPQRLYEVLSTSGGRSHHFVSRFPKALAGDYSPGFTIALGEKDLGLGLELARAVGVPAPAAGTVRALYGVAMAEGDSGDDIVGLLKMYQRWTPEK